MLRAEEKQKREAEALQRGLYVSCIMAFAYVKDTNVEQHFAYRPMQSHAYGEPLISKDSRPDEVSAMESVQKYMRQTAWEHEVVSSWFKSVDHSKWEEYHDSYQEFRSELGHLY